MEGEDVHFGRTDFQNKGPLGIFKCGPFTLVYMTKIPRGLRLMEDA